MGVDQSGKTIGDVLGLDSKNRKIEFSLGSTIEECVNELIEYKNSGKSVYGVFNGVELFSESVSMDSAYLLITGKTKTEHDASFREYMERHTRDKNEHERKIPELTKIWIDAGRETISQDRWAYWEKIVPIRLGDIYEGAELGACLDIIKVLNTGGSMEEAKKLIDDQGHSGMSFGIVRSMVKAFADRGEEFFEYVS